VDLRHSLYKQHVDLATAHAAKLRAFAEQRKQFAKDFSTFADTAMIPGALFPPTPDKPGRNRIVHSFNASLAADTARLAALKQGNTLQAAAEAAAAAAPPVPPSPSETIGYGRPKPSPTGILTGSLGSRHDPQVLRLQDDDEAADASDVAADRQRDTRSRAGSYAPFARNGAVPRTATTERSSRRRGCMDRRDANRGHQDARRSPSRRDRDYQPGTPDSRDSYDDRRRRDTTHDDRARRGYGRHAERRGSDESSQHGSPRYTTCRRDESASLDASEERWPPRRRQRGYMEPRDEARRGGGVGAEDRGSGRGGGGGGDVRAMQSDLQQLKDMMESMMLWEGKRGDRGDDSGERSRDFAVPAAAVHRKLAGAQAASAALQPQRDAAAAVAAGGAGNELARLEAEIEKQKKVTQVR
jgi:hypothetical protein